MVLVVSYINKAARVPCGYKTDALALPALREIRTSMFKSLFKTPIVHYEKIFLLVLIGLFLAQTACSRSDEARPQKILSSSEPPVGVVFEIASGDDDGLRWAIPMVQSYAKELREKFPGIELAVVSHGEELFQLTRDNRQYFAETHKQVQSLVEDQDIEVHVCGNYAASSGINEDEFVDYVDVAERGPAQVRAYKNAGYELLFIRQPTEQINRFRLLE